MVSGVCVVVVVVVDSIPLPSLSLSLICLLRIFSIIILIPLVIQSTRNLHRSSVPCLASLALSHFSPSSPLSSPVSSPPLFSQHLARSSPLPL